MTGFEPQTSGIGSDRSTNWATTTALRCAFLLTKKFQSIYPKNLLLSSPANQELDRFI